MFTVVLLAAVCAAQSSNQGEVFAGYSHIVEDFSLTNPNAGLTGWNASFTSPSIHRVGFVADFAGFYPGHNFGCQGCGQSAKVHTFLFGPQYSFTKGRWTVFGRFLFGDTNLRTHADLIPTFLVFSSTNSFTYGAGGGIEYALTRRFGLRGQADWLHNGFQTADNQQTSAEIHNVVRISTGIVFRF
jgi:hypothetical protein